MAIKIRIGSFEKCVDLSFKIPEFNSPFEIKEYKKRCAGKHLALIAKIDNQPVGFKVGYDRFNNGSFYSWMGGVLPDFRQKGVVSLLADLQENWAIINEYNSILLKTRKKHKAMISFFLKRGFSITEENRMNPNEETRIWMEKVF